MRFWGRIKKEEEEEEMERMEVTLGGSTFLLFEQAPPTILAVTTRLSLRAVRKPKVRKPTPPMERVVAAACACLRLQTSLFLVPPSFLPLESD